MGRPAARDSERIDIVLGLAVGRTNEENAAIREGREARHKDYQEHYVKLRNGVVVCFGYAKNNGGASYELMSIDMEKSLIPVDLSSAERTLFTRWFYHDSIVIRIEDIERGWFGYRYVSTSKKG